MRLTQVSGTWHHLACKLAATSGQPASREMGRNAKNGPALEDDSDKVSVAAAPY